MKNPRSPTPHGPYSGSMPVPFASILFCKIPTLPAPTALFWRTQFLHSVFSSSVILRKSYLLSNLHLHYHSWNIIHPAYWWLRGFLFKKQTW